MREGSGGKTGSGSGPLVIMEITCTVVIMEIASSLPTKRDVNTMLTLVEILITVLFDDARIRLRLKVVPCPAYYYVFLYRVYFNK